jgi:hypothetical protein
MKTPNTLKLVDLPKLVGVQLHPFRQGPAQVVPEPAKVRGNTKWEIEENHGRLPTQPSHLLVTFWVCFLKICYNKVDMF